MPTRSAPHIDPDHEAASSTIEYVGLGSLATLLVTGLAAALDSAAGDRVAAAVVRRLVEAITGIE